MLNEPIFEIKHRLIKKRDKILMRRFKDIPDECFNIRIFVEGNLSLLKRVEYELHSSFHNPLKSISTPKGGFPLEIWTWGEFDIDVTFYLSDGGISETVFSLSYSDELPAEDEAYIDVTPKSLKRA